MRNGPVSKCGRFFTFLTLPCLKVLKPWKGFVKNVKESLFPSDDYANKRHPGIYEETTPSRLVRGVHRAGVWPGNIDFAELHLGLSLGIAAYLNRTASSFADARSSRNQDRSLFIRAARPGCVVSA